MVFFEIMTIPLIVIVVLFVIFWIVQEGTRWQKHPYLGAFARFIQKSPSRGFFTFLTLTILMVPSVLGILEGIWIDGLITGRQPANTAVVVNTLLIMFLLLAAMIPAVWTNFRTWRHSVRSAAEVRVRTS
ncbi:MAG: hypothetical protein GF411_00265 [Candidatus Lokiarchaeota archaeon]|nr:hypothetical protein [Candidatus Lokiarchaeota archaeon]